MNQHQIRQPRRVSCPVSRFVQSDRVSLREQEKISKLNTGPPKECNAQCVRGREFHILLTLVQPGVSNTVKYSCCVPNTQMCALTSEKVDLLLRSLLFVSRNPWWIQWACPPDLNGETTRGSLTSVVESVNALLRML